MHRIERIELDLPDGSLPSLSQRFLAKTGRDPAGLLNPAEANSKIDCRAGPLGSAVNPAEDPA